MAPNAKSAPHIGGGHFFNGLDQSNYLMFLLILWEKKMNRVIKHTGAKYPIIQAPMGWIARSQLASAVCNAEV